MRETGVGNPWTIGTSVAFNSTIYDETGHYIRTFTFAGLTGDPVAIIYGLEFPWGIIAQCVEDENPPEGLPPVMEAQQPIAIDSEQEKRKTARQQVIEMRDKMNLVREKPCIHLGEALETIASCGCTGGILHACTKHGKCRVSGNTVEMNCWRCPDYANQSS